MAEISVDISEYQVPVNDSYPHQWLSFRACDGDYVDRNAALNLAWARTAKTSGKLADYAVYVVYRPGLNATILRHLDELSTPHDCVVMVDAETWGGAISGDHSAELNALATALANRQGGQDRVWGYGNRNDLSTVWPGRPAWLGVVLASYGGSQPTDIPNLVGWQYTDGQYAVAGYPSSSAPFGPCDHNVFFAAEADLTPEQNAMLQTVLNIVATSRTDGNRTASGWPYAFTPDAALLTKVDALAKQVSDLAAKVGAPVAPPSAADIAKAVVAALPTDMAVTVDVNSLAAAIASHVKLAAA